MPITEVLAQARARYDELSRLGEYSVQAREVLELYRLVIGLAECVEARQALTVDDVVAALGAAQPPVVNASDKPVKTKG